MRLGERIFRANRLPLAPDQLLAMARTSPDKTAHILVVAQGHAIVGWLIVAPGIVLLLTLLLRPLIRLLLLRARDNPKAVTIQR